MITDGEATYFLQAAGDQLHVDEGTYTVKAGLPAMNTSTNLADPKTITFQAIKDGYTNSEVVSGTVIVLGDRLVGTASRIISAPNVNYLVLHDPPGDGSYSFTDDSLTVKGIITNMKIQAKDGDIPVFPAPWRVERDIDGADFSQLEGVAGHGLLGNRDTETAEARFREAATFEGLAGAGTVVAGPYGFLIRGTIRPV